jgi:hypothetical protein
VIVSVPALKTLPPKSRCIAGESTLLVMVNIVAAAVWIAPPKASLSISHRQVRV